MLSLMAECRSNAAIASQLVVPERAIEKHISGIFLNSTYRRLTPTIAGSSPCSNT